MDQPNDRETDPIRHCRRRKRPLLVLVMISALIIVLASQIVIRILLGRDSGQLQDPIPAADIGHRIHTYRNELVAAITEADRLDPGWRESRGNKRQFPPDKQNAAQEVNAVQSLLLKRWFPEQFKYDGPGGPASMPGEWVFGPLVPERDMPLRNMLDSLSPQRQPNERQLVWLRADLQRAGPALDRARRLADMPESGFPVDKATHVRLSSAQCPWPERVSLLDLLLREDVVLRNQDGDPNAAFLSARALLTVGRYLLGSPFLGYGPECRRNDVVWAVERTLAQSQPAESALATMQQSLEQEDSVQVLLGYLRQYRASEHGFRTSVDAAREGDWVVPQKLHAHNEAVEIAKLPVDQQWPLYRVWHRRWYQAEKPGQEGWTLHSFLRTDEGWIVYSSLRTHALLRCAIVALAAERYRIKHGAWPRVLTNLVPEYLASVPLDPFDAAPLRYRQTDSGAVIYSVGSDGRDDGGDATITPGEYAPRDIVFKLWNVDQRRQPPKPPS